MKITTTRMMKKMGRNRDGADTVTVKVDGKVTGTYPLAKDQKIRINGGTNILTIKNGKAY